MVALSTNTLSSQQRQQASRPFDSLSKIIPSSSIAAANEDVSNATWSGDQECTQRWDRDWGQYMINAFSQKCSGVIVGVAPNVACSHWICSARMAIPRDLLPTSRFAWVWRASWWLRVWVHKALSKTGAGCWLRLTTMAWHQIHMEHMYATVVPMSSTSTIWLPVLLISRFLTRTHGPWTSSDIPLSLFQLSYVHFPQCTPSTVWFCFFAFSLINFLCIFQVIAQK